MIRIYLPMLILFCSLVCHAQQVIQVSSAYSNIELLNRFQNLVKIKKSGTEAIIVVFNGDTLEEESGSYLIDLSGKKKIEPGYYSLDCYSAMNGELIEQFETKITNGEFIASVGFFRHNDTIRSSHFSVQRGVFVRHHKPNIRCSIYHYKYQVIRNDSVVFTERVVSSPAFTDRIKAFNKQLLPNDMILLTELQGLLGASSEPISDIEPVIYYIK